MQSRMGVAQLDTAVVRFATTAYVGSEVIDVSHGRDVLVVRTLMAAICGTDIGVVRGLRTDIPRVLGHEFVGEVVFAGPSFECFPAGTLITLNPNRVVAVHERFGETVDGAFRTLVTFDASFIELGQLFAVPPSMPLVRAALIEPVACVLHAHAAIATHLEGGSIAIIGGGNFAKLHSLLAERSATDVTVMVPNQQRIEDGASRDRFVGVAMALASSSSEFDATFDAVVVAVSQGTLSFFADAVRLVREGGVIHFWGPVPPEQVLADDDGQLIRPAELRQRNALGPLVSPDAARFAGKAVLLTGTRGARNSDFVRAIELLAEVQAESIVSHVSSLNAVPEVLATLADPQGWRAYPGKVVVDFTLPNGVLTLVEHRESGHGKGDSLSWLIDQLASCRRTSVGTADICLIGKAYALARSLYCDGSGIPLLHPASGAPVIEHVVDVAAMLLALGTIDAELIAAALLHDAFDQAGADPDVLRSVSGAVHDIAVDLSQGEPRVECSVPLSELFRAASDATHGLSAGWEPNAAIKYEHFTRLAARPLDARSVRLKLIDNAVAYSARNNEGVRKWRSPLELVLFEAYMNRVLGECDELLQQQLVAVLDLHWRDLGQSLAPTLRSQLAVAATECFV